LRSAVYFSDRAQMQTAAVNQNGTVAFKPLLLPQARYQLFDCRLVAGDQQQADFVAPAEQV
jgi:hypothetical protein